MISFNVGDSSFFSWRKPNGLELLRVRNSLKFQLMHCVFDVDFGWCFKFGNLEIRINVIIFFQRSKMFRRPMRNEWSLVFLIQRVIYMWTNTWDLWIIAILLKITVFALQFDGFRFVNFLITQNEFFEQFLVWPTLEVKQFLNLFKLLGGPLCEYIFLLGFSGQ